MTESTENLSTQWDELVALLKENGDLGRRNYANIKLLVPQAIMGDTLILATRDEAIRRKIKEEKVFDIFQKAVKQTFNAIPQIVIDKTLPLAPVEDQLFTLEPEDAKVTKLPKQSQATATILEPKYTFKTFVQGTGNSFAKSVAVAVAEAPAEAYNPLFIYGGSGLGKTHLLQAIGHYVLDEFKDKKVVYVTSEQYLDDFLKSVRRSTSEQEKDSFKRKYRDIDVLLVDDIQFLAKKDGSQEEFFHIFNSLLGGAKQVVLTSDVPPKDLKQFEDRLLSRFAQGMLADLTTPDVETRMAILQNINHTDSLNVPNDVIEFISSNISTNIRELEGALLRVSAYGDLNDVPLTVDLTQNTILKDVLNQSENVLVTPETIIEQTAEYFDLKREDLLSNSRSRSIVFPRQVAMYLCRELIPDMTLALIGKAFGGKDHTTVMHAYKTIADQMKNNKKVYDNISEISTTIKES